MRIVCDPDDSSGQYVRVYQAATEAGLDTAAACRISNDATLDVSGGLLGLAMGGGVVHIDNLTVDTPNASGWTTEARDDFNQTADYGREQPTHAAAGNLTYDGLYQYTYDAWNHLVKASRAYRDPDTGPLAVESTVQTARHDGLGRRIVKAVRNSADLNCTYHYYYDGQSVGEERDGSDLTIKQHVWGNLAGGYIDELMQTAINEDPLTDSTCETVYYAATGPNYNVLGLFDETGALAERYEYTPYGQRQVYTSSGTNDPAAHAPLLMSRRVEDPSGNPQPYGLNAIGHQGKTHDEATGLICYNARYLHPRLGRFISRDPAGYIDGQNLYQYVRSNPLVFLDPTGLWTNKGLLDAYRKEYGDESFEKLMFLLSAGVTVVKEDEYWFDDWAVIGTEIHIGDNSCWLWDKSDENAAAQLNEALAIHFGVGDTTLLYKAGRVFRGGVKTGGGVLTAAGGVYFIVQTGGVGAVAGGAVLVGFGGNTVAAGITQIMGLGEGENGIITPSKNI